MQVKARDRAQSVPVSGETRGHAIRKRRLAHGIKSLREFALKSGVSRDAVTAAEDGLASDTTYDRLEAWLDAFEEETGAERPGDPHVVTIRGKRGGDVDVVVSGAIEDIDVLAATAERLLYGPAAQEAVKGGPDDAEDD